MARPFESCTTVRVVVDAIVIVAFPLTCCRGREFSAAPAPEDKVEIAAAPFELGQVEITGGPFRNSQQLDVRYLLQLEPDRLLAWFHKEAGMPTKGEVYGGWESETLAGHTLGHYLTACSLGYRTTGDKRLKDRVDYLVAELARCQSAHGDGYVGAIPGGRQMFQQVKSGDIRSKGFDLNGIWSPFYTMHKLFAGLRDAHRLCSNPQALDVLTKLGDWCWDVTGELNDEQVQQLLHCEFGGMNEVMADLYELTGEPRYWEMASRVFYHHAVLDPLAARQDQLDGLHSNTQVPKIIGLAKLYELSGEPQYRQMAEYFWDRVVHHHTYVNGGNSSHEYFGPSDQLARRLGQTTETCNTYNMLRLTRHLFSWAPTSTYFDYYERALWNHILAHQHPSTGMFAYKGFLEPGTRLGFSDPENSFWCCVGTGLENHVKHGDSIYFHDAEGLYVNLFLPSRLDWQERDVRVRQETDLPVSNRSLITFECDAPQRFAVRVRSPAWADAGVTVKVNGQAVDATLSPTGYLVVERKWKSGDQLLLEFPLRLRVESTPDDPNIVAFLYGPILLCAELGENQSPPVLVAEEGELIAEFKTAAEPLRFAAESVGRSVDVSPARAGQFGEPTAVRLVPHHGIADARYSVYLQRIDPAAWPAYAERHQRRLAEAQELAARTVDALRIGEMQPERDHNLQSENSQVGEVNGRKWRDARDGGWFAFDMKTLPDEPLALQCTYWGEESTERVFDILVDDIPIATQTLQRNRPGEFFDVLYEVPPELTRGKESVRVRFQAGPGGMAGGVFGTIRMLKAKAEPVANTSD